MIENLLKIQKELKETIEFEEDGHLNLVAVEKKELSLTLKYQIFTGSKDEPVQLWEIICNGEKEHKIILGEQDYDEEYSDFELFNDHVLLWTYNQPISSLTFNKIDSDIDEFYVIGKLYQKHIDLVGSWIPFDFCFNQSSNLESLISVGYGKLAEGAEKLIIGYQEVMNECGFQSSYLSRPPKQWDNKKGWIYENSNLQVLITGQSYVIASDFTAKRIID